jgi:hypothetical protein
LRSLSTPIPTHPPAASPPSSLFPPSAQAAKVAGEPTPFLSDPTAASTTRCKRRFNDLSLLRLDALAREWLRAFPRRAPPQPRAAATLPMPRAAPRPPFAC